MPSSSSLPDLKLVQTGRFTVVGLPSEQDSEQLPPIPHRRIVMTEEKETKPTSNTAGECDGVVRVLLYRYGCCLCFHSSLISFLAFRFLAVTTQQRRSCCCYCCPCPRTVKQEEYEKGSSSGSTKGGKTVDR